MGFSRQEYWSGLPFSSPVDLPDPGIALRSPALQVDSLLSEPPHCLSFFSFPIILSPLQSGICPMLFCFICSSKGKMSSYCLYLLTSDHSNFERDTQHCFTLIITSPSWKDFLPYICWLLLSLHSPFWLLFLSLSFFFFFFYCKFPLCLPLKYYQSSHLCYWVGQNVYLVFPIAVMEKPKELFGQSILYMISSTPVVSSTGDKLSLGSSPSQIFNRNMDKTSLFPQALECINWR